MRTGPVAAQIDQAQRSGGAYRGHKPGFDLDPREFAPAAAREAVAAQGLPECTAYRIRRIQHRIVFPRVAEPAWRGRRPQRGPAAVAMDHAEDALETDATQPVRIVAAGHAKSPCRSPSAAFTTRSISPPASSVSGFPPSSEDCSVVSQTQAA